MSQRVIYEAADFDFGKLQPPAAMGDLGFSGLRILTASDQGFQDVAIFQGASFYRSRANGQNFGVTARGLAIRTGDEPGEEFPLFREFWIEKPAPATNTLTIYALLDSASMTGAFRFTMRPLRDDDHRHRNDADRARRDRQVRHRRDGGSIPLQRTRSSATRRLARRRLRSNRPANPDRRRTSGCGGPSAIARPCRSPPSPTSIRAASVSCSARGLRRFLRRRRPLGTAPVAVDRTDRRLGRRRRAAARNPGRVREQRQYHRAMATEGRHGGGRDASRSPTGSSGAGRRRRGRRSPFARRAAPGRWARASASPSK